MLAVSIAFSTDIPLIDYSQPEVEGVMVICIDTMMDTLNLNSILKRKL